MAASPEQQPSIGLPQQRTTSLLKQPLGRSSLLTLNVDSQAEAAYVWVQERSVRRTVAVHPQVRLHLDSDDHVVCVEIHP